jgi:hypothetical protein
MGPRKLNRGPAVLTLGLALVLVLGGVDSPISGFMDHDVFGNWLFQNAYWFAWLSAILWQIVFAGKEKDRLLH